MGPAIMTPAKPDPVRERALELALMGVSQHNTSINMTMERAKAFYAFLKGEE